MSGGSPYAEIAQLVEHLICNQAVVGSNPSFGSMFFGDEVLLVVIHNSQGFTHTIRTER